MAELNHQKLLQPVLCAIGPAMMVEDWCSLVLEGREMMATLTYHGGCVIRGKVDRLVQASLVQKRHVRNDHRDECLSRSLESCPFPAVDLDLPLLARPQCHSRWTLP